MLQYDTKLESKINSINFADSNLSWLGENTLDKNIIQF